MPDWFTGSTRAVWQAVARGLVADGLAGLRARSRAYESKGGTQSEGLTCDQAVDYAMAGYAGLRERIPANLIAGSRILEIGPGDNQALGLCFLAAGAGCVVGLDRFRIAHDPRKRREIYATLLSRMSEAQRARLQTVIDVSRDPPWIDDTRLRLITGVGLEDAGTALGPQTFDVILSVAVGEHLYDSDLAFEAMDRLLAPGGAMIHQIDLNDHGTFTGRGLHPLTWLTVPDWAYKRMVKHRGGPNRRLTDYYRSKLDSMGYSYTLFVSQVVGEKNGLSPYPPALVRGHHYDVHHEQLVDEIRAKLVDRYRSLASEDLMTAGILLVAQK